MLLKFKNMNLNCNQNSNFKNSSQHFTTKEKKWGQQNMHIWKQECCNGNDKFNILLLLLLLSAEKKE